MENSDGLIRTALREGEENAERLARTQLLTIPFLIVAMISVPAFRIVGAGAWVVDMVGSPCE